MGLIEERADLFGGTRAVACSDASGLSVSEIPKRKADALIKAGHYSHSVVWSSSEHFGVFAGGALIGALQFGPAMNPASGSRVVSGTGREHWMELNRMWLADDKPDNCASRAVAFSLRLLRKKRPQLKWVQSFADSRCGKLGGVYQACSFVYCGSHASTFYEIDGEWFHKSMAGRAAYDKRGWWSGPKIEFFNANKERAVKHTFTQYRYVRFLDPRWRSRLLLSPLPYPKPSSGEPRSAHKAG